MKTLLAALTVLPLCLPSAAFGEDYEDLDGASSQKKKKKKKAKKSTTVDLSNEIVREVERGFFVKSAIGGQSYVGAMKAVVQLGTSLTLSVGNDFSDSEKQSLAWEIGMYQAIHNGMEYKRQPQIGMQGSIQGDSHFYALQGSLEFSKYVTRRFGVGLRAGGGVMFIPLLMDKTAFTNDVVGGQWGGSYSGVHDGPLPMGFGGPTFEYYTKMSHFSIGLDVDVSYILGFDLGVGGQGYVKYTF